MRAHEVVALNHISSSINDPGEFVLATVDPHGKLWQRSGKDPEISHLLRNLVIHGIERGSLESDSTSE